MQWLTLAAGIVLLASMAQAETTIVRNGQTDYRIVTPDRPSPAVKTAAKELQSFVYRIASVRMPIVTESRAADAPAFLIGPCRHSAEAGLVDRASKLAEDGILIKTLGRDIALLGSNERGHLYSVYVLLEKFLGVRFLAWDCTIVPAAADLTLPEIDYAYAPPFMYRETLYWNSFPKEIATRQRLNGPYTKCDETVGGKIAFFPYVHSFDDLIPPEEYFKDHPEYFSLQGGKRVAEHVHAQICLSNREVLRLAKEKVLKWCEEHPDIPIIDVSQNDGNGWCECEHCMAIVNEEGSQHGPILRFVNAIADEVAKKYPDKWVETLAYAYSTRPPAITKPRPNVIIRLCHAGCYYHGFEKCGLGANLTTYIDQWSRLTRRIFIWHYATNFAHYIAPCQNLSGLAKDIKHYGRSGVNGLMVQCNYQGPGGELAELRQYLAAQLMWDPSQDPMKLREEFCRGYYGEAADDVLAFLALMDKAAARPVSHAFGAWDPLTTTPDVLVKESLLILNKARHTTSGRVVKNRIDKLLLPLWYMQLTYPESYGLSASEARRLWPRVKQVIDTNKITHISEGKLSKDWIVEMDAAHSPLAPGVVFDLAHAGRAKTDNCFAWQATTVEKSGRTLRGVLQHPNREGDATAVYEVPLPLIAEGEKLLLKFGTVVTQKSANGVRFSVVVDCSEKWNETKTTYLLPPDEAAKTAQDAILPGQSPFSDHLVDLSGSAGKTIELTLRVNALGDHNHDWATWVEPRIVVEK